MEFHGNFLFLAMIAEAHMIPHDPAQLAGTVMVAEIDAKEIRMIYQIS